MKNENQESKRPETSFKMGGVRAAIWKRTGQTKNGGTFESRRVVLDRAFKDAQGQWQNTGSLDMNDLPKAIWTLQKAYEYLGLKHRDREDFEEAPVQEEVVA